MSDLMVNLIYIPLAVLTVWMLCSLWRHDRHRRLAANMAFILLSVLGWQLSQIAYHAASSFSLSYWLYDLDKVFVALLTMALFLFIIRFFSLNAYASPPIVIVIGLIPCISTVLSLMPGRHEFWRVGLVILETSPVHRAAFEARGLWYWVHAGYSYLITLLSALVILVQYRNLPVRYRLSARLMLLGMAGSIMGNLLVILRVFPTSFDFSLVAVTGTTVLFFLANRKNHGLDLIVQARASVFTHLDEAVVVLDESGRIARKNPHAQTLLEGFGEQDAEEPFPEVLQRIRARAVRVQRDEELGGTDLYFQGEDRSLVLHLREKPMLAAGGQNIGTFFTCKDVTGNRLLIEKLEGEAGLDVLTGLLNQKSMERERMALDTEDALPLGVIVGNLNDLRPVNRRSGREQGDAALRLAAEVLTASCPPDARIGRVAGDEFHVLLPGLSEEQLYALLRQIRENLASHPMNYHQITMALGAALRTDMQQRLTTVLLEADHHMRLDKQATKAAKK